jgi:hypothetical protein
MINVILMPFRLVLMGACRVSESIPVHVLSVLDIISMVGNPMLENDLATTLDTTND